MPSTTSPLTTKYRMDRATSSAPPSHSETRDHFSSRKVRLPTWMSDMNATRAWPEAPGNAFVVGRSGRTSEAAITSPFPFTVPTMPTTSSGTTVSEASGESAGDIQQDPHHGPCVRGAFDKPSERRGDGFRRARGRRGNRSNPGGRGPSDAGRMSDVRQGHEERRFGARPEESFEFRDGVL